MSSERARPLSAPNTTCARARRSGVVRDRQTFFPLMSRLARWKKKKKKKKVRPPAPPPDGELGRRLREEAVGIARNLATKSLPQFPRTNSRSWSQQSTEKRARERRNGRGGGPAGDYCLLWPSFPPSVPPTKQKVRGKARKIPHMCFAEASHTREFVSQMWKKSATVSHKPIPFNINCMLRLIHRESRHFWSIGRSS